MYIEFTVDGASAVSQEDSPGFTTSRQIMGTLTPGARTLTVSGTVFMGNGYGADADVSVSAGGESANKDLGYIKTGFPGYNSAPFSVSVPIPSGASGGSFSIHMVGEYNAGSRGLVVSGSLEGSGGSGATSAPSVPVTSADGGGSESDEPDPISWTVIVGALAALGVGAAGVAAAISRRKPPVQTDRTDKGKEEKEKEKGVGYILQLSTAAVRVSAERPGTLEVTAWKRVGNGPLEPAPEAVITVIPPAGSGLVISPTQTGRQQLTISIAPEPNGAPGPVVLTVSASAPGGGTESTVTVEIEATMQVGFE